MVFLFSWRAGNERTADFFGTTARAKFNSDESTSFLFFHEKLCALKRNPERIGKRKWERRTNVSMLNRIEESWKLNNKMLLFVWELRAKSIDSTRTNGHANSSKYWIREFPRHTLARTYMRLFLGHKKELEEKKSRLRFRTMWPKKRERTALYRHMYVEEASWKCSSGTKQLWTIPLNKPAVYSFRESDEFITFFFVHYKSICFVRIWTNTRKFLRLFYPFVYMQDLNILQNFRNCWKPS